MGTISRNMSILHIGGTHSYILSSDDHGLAFCFTYVLEHVTTPGTHRLINPLVHLKSVLRPHSLGYLLRLISYEFLLMVANFFKF